jgi:phosphoserine aminotransferase
MSEQRPGHVTLADPGTAAAGITIPASLRPADGRFGCGPSKVRPEQLAALAGPGAALMGTSHRQAPVRSLVQRIREGLASYFSLPAGYEVVLGNGGTTAFWEIAAFGLVRTGYPNDFNVTIDMRTVQPVQGITEAIQQTAKRAGVEIEIIPGAQPPVPRPGWILCADPQRDVHRRGHAGRPSRQRGSRCAAAGGRHSGAGELPVRPATSDVHFAPRNASARTAGYGLHCCRKRRHQGGAHRVQRPVHPGVLLCRWPSAIPCSRPTTRRRSPTLSAGRPVYWMLDQGGLEWAIARTADSRLGCTVGGEGTVRDVRGQPQQRSQVVGTIDFDAAVDAAALAAALRANGIVDTEPYRKLGRNQLRIGMFPAVDPADVRALTACIDYAIERL